MSDVQKSSWLDLFFYWPFIKCSLFMPPQINGQQKLNLLLPSQWLCPPPGDHVWVLSMSTWWEWYHTFSLRLKLCFSQFYISGDEVWRGSANADSIYQWIECWLFYWHLILWTILLSVHESNLQNITHILHK